MALWGLDPDTGLTGKFRIRHDKKSRVGFDQGTQYASTSFRNQILFWRCGGYKCKFLFSSKAWIKLLFTGIQLSWSRSVLSEHLRNMSRKQTAFPLHKIIFMSVIYLFFVLLTYVDAYNVLLKFKKTLSILGTYRPRTILNIKNYKIGVPFPSLFRMNWMFEAEGPGQPNLSQPAYVQSTATVLNFFNVGVLYKYTDYLFRQRNWKDFRTI
jgi:hypothetical protein